MGRQSEGFKSRERASSFLLTLKNKEALVTTDDRWRRDGDVVEGEGRALLMKKRQGSPKKVTSIGQENRGM